MATIELGIRRFWCRAGGCGTLAFAGDATKTGEEVAFGVFGTVFTGIFRFCLAGPGYWVTVT